MKRIALTILLLMPLMAGAQQGVDAVPVFRASPFDAQAAAMDDLRRDAAGDLPLYGRSLALGAHSMQGAWREEQGERTCRLAVSSPGALAMELFLENVSVPTGARMRILDGSGVELHAFFPVVLPAGIHEFSTPLVGGDHWILEYREPAVPGVQGYFEIPRVGHAYRFVEEFAEREGNCHVNVACSPEGDGWEAAIRASVRISVVVPQGTGWCTGTLMNNVREDCAPYILSAYHCGRESTTANFNQYKFYFNFQYATCSGGAYSTAQFITGAQLKAYSDDYAPQYQGLGGSDFMLLRTNTDIPEAYDPYWAGWDATNLSTVTDDGVCIHHPTGAPKRVSSYTQTLVTGHPMASSGLMSHYKVVWAQTVHGWGITEVGSSGAGLFKQKAGAGPVLIGTCTGNSSGMSCSNHTGYAYFGKMSYHWTQNPNAANIKLKPWLDPDNTGTLVLSGSDDPCATSTLVAGPTAADQPVVYPNPASDQVTLAWPGAANARFTFLDAAGHIVLAGGIAAPQATINIAALPNGCYLLRVERDEGIPLSARITILR
ncbi:MAG: T9SS type A sorting domain-containing protein [Flavobacteriales bacterium]|nr:T9SS type A sorting domain-containing protein [Flavobacteriales bacterium]